MPRALAWFNALFADSIAPALAQLFLFSAARLRVHDAFLVRYRHPHPHPHPPIEGDREGGAKGTADLLQPYRLYLQDQDHSQIPEEEEEEAEEEEACAPRQSQSQRYLPLQYVPLSLPIYLSITISLCVPTAS